MSTKELFRDNAYLKQASAEVTGFTENGGVVLDQSVFYPTGGGQPGDTGAVSWPGGTFRVQETVKGQAGAIVLVPEEGGAQPPIGQIVDMQLDWDRRYKLMRMHTALHLLSVAIPFGVTGGSISEGKGRLDFDMAEPPSDKDAISTHLNEMISTDAMVTEEWITDADLDAQPDLVKTMSVRPPRGSGKIRLVRIGDADRAIDLQPCGGTHVRNLSEIGRVRIGKVEKKGRMNRRVYLHLEV